MKSKLLTIFSVFCIFSTLFAADKFSIILKTDKVDGIYKQGDSAIFNVTILKNGEVAQGVKFTCQFSANGFWQNKKEYISDGKTVTLTRKFDAPVIWHTLRVEISGTKIVNEIGAIASPYDIKTAVEEPEDFEAFWKKQREELNKIPVEAIEKKPYPLWAPYNKTVVCYDMKIKCLGGKPVSGYLSMPRNAKPKSLPAVVSFHGAGVRSAYAHPHIGEKMISFNVNAHGIENSKPDEYYQSLKLSNGKKLVNYAWHGIWDKDQCYYKNMFLRVMRALDYIKTLPEWDGKNLFVTGASQGGAQSIVAAALDKDVTFCQAGVPALCDHNAFYANRTPGWPKVANLSDKSKLTSEKKCFMAVMNYYDVAHFAKRVKCEITVAAGLIDHVCSPISVMAAYNNIPATAKKSIQIKPAGSHGNASAGLEKRYNAVVDKAIKTNKTK